MSRERSLAAATYVPRFDSPLTVPYFYGVPTAPHDLMPQPLARLSLSTGPADNERRLTKRCAEITNAQVEASARAKAAAVLGEEDQKTIIALRDEIEGAWSQLDASREKVGWLCCTDMCTPGCCSKPVALLSLAGR